MISSTKNPAIKQILKLEKPRERKESQLFVIEGTREIDRAIQSGYKVEKLFLCPDLKNFTHTALLDKIPSDKQIAVSPNVFSRIAYRDHKDGLIAISKMKKHEFREFTPKAGELYLVAENVEKPGNLGALLRTADAAGIQGLFVCDNQTDIYNPNVIRSSLGCLFSVPVFCGESKDLIKCFRESNIRIFAAALQNSEEYYAIDFTGSAAIVLGSEANGLTRIWREAAHKIIRIPMAGIADSLNVSVSAAILTFEALRQRK